MSFPLPTIDSVNETYREKEANPESFLGSRYLPYRDSRRRGKQVRWAVYEESTGMTYVHIFNTDPKRINKTPKRLYTVDSQPYKELYPIGEDELTYASTLEDSREKAELNYLIGQGLMELDLRQQVRMEHDRWKVLQTSKLTIVEEGVTREIDFGIPAGNFLTVGSGVGVAWTDFANATPLTDFAALVEKFDDVDHDGIDINFNKTTARLLLKNEQILDKLSGLDSSMDWNLANMPTLLARMVGDVASFNIYHKGFKPEDGGARQRFIDDNNVNAIARPEHATNEGNRLVGQFVGTDSIHAGALKKPRPGRFAVPDYSNARRESPNPHIDIVGGVYGMAVLQRPSHVANAKVTA